MSNDLKQMAALTALNEMLAGSSPSICTIDQVGRMLGIDPKRAGDAYQILHTLHCVNYSKMPRELRDQIPGLVQQCLGVETTFQFDACPTPDAMREAAAKLVRTIDAATSEASKPRGFLGRLVR